ncbi:MAG TPA: RidA family protein [Chitinophagaceae bacterium]|nr:RidA family protein [Chitinophagaceae bacterium]
MERQLISSGTVWEKKYGYSRAVKVGNLVFVAGTTAVDENGEIVGIGDMYAQTDFIYKKINKALQQAGAGMADIVRIRTFITDMSRYQEVLKSQGEVFENIRPAATLVEVTALIDERLLVEIEADAVIG